MGDLKPRQRVLILAITIGVLLLMAQCTSAERLKRDYTLRSCANTKCNTSFRILKGENLPIICKTRGQVIGGNSFWLKMRYCRGAGPDVTCVSGYVPDEYVDCGGRVCPGPSC